VKPVQQTKRGGPNVPPEDRGDCWSAVLASLLEVDIEDVAVPHSDDPEWHWWDATQRALEPHGYHCVVADTNVYPDGYWLAAVPSLNLGNYDDGRPVLHIIVMHDGDVVHDPGIGDKRYEPGTRIEDLDVRDAFVLVPHEIRSKVAA
jgi:hypothetical protein